MEKIQRLQKAKLYLEMLSCSMDPTTQEFIENEVLQEVCRYVLIQGTGVNREFLSGVYAGIEKLLHQVVNGRHYLKTERGDKVIVI